VDNDIITGYPVDGRRHLVLVAGLQAVDDAEDLVAVAARGGGVGEDGADGLLGVDDEDRADGESNSLLVDVGGVLVVQHVVLEGDLTVLVTDDGEVDLVSADFLDILDPAIMRVDGVGAQANQLDTALREFWFELSKSSQFSGANRGVILGMREENHPVVADEVMEVDWALGGLRLEVRGDGTQTERCSSWFSHFIRNLRYGILVWVEVVVLKWVYGECIEVVL